MACSAAPVASVPATAQPTATLQPNQIVLPTQAPANPPRCDNGKNLGVDVTNNADGVAFVHTEPALLLEDHLISYTYAPGQCRIAVLTEDTRANNIWGRRTLWAIDLLSRKILLKQALLTDAMRQGEVNTGSATGGRPEEAMYALNGLNMQWSPDTTKLAFASAHDGPSADLYVFDTQTSQVSRLTDGPTQVGDVHWSPDSHWLYHQAVSSFGTGAGWTVDSVWVAAADGSSNHKLDATPGMGYVFIDWLSPTEVILANRTALGADNIRIMNVETGATRPLFVGLYHAARFETSQARLLVSDFPINATADKNTPMAYKLWAVPINGDAPSVLKESTDKPIELP